MEMVMMTIADMKIVMMTIAGSACGDGDDDDS